MKVNGSIVGTTLALGLATSILMPMQVNAASQQVTAVGSTALQPLAQQAAEHFQKKHPKITVTVQGGGSGAGLSQVGKGKVTIGNSDIFASQKKGVDARKLKDHKVAVVGITPVVNKDVAVKDLSMAELKDIFTGKITNWQEVGGKDEKIVLINRAQGSGTRFTFEQEVLDGKTAKTAQEQDDSGAVQKIVKQTPGAVSYLAFSYTDGQAAKGLKTVKIDGVKPSEKHVAKNEWKIWAYEHMYTVKKPDQATKKFVKYMTSKKVEKDTKKLGYVPMSDMKVEKNDQGDVKKLK